MMKVGRTFIRKREVLFFCSLTAILLVCLVVSFLISHHGPRSPEAAPTGPNLTAFQNVSLIGKSAYVLDVRTGEVLYEKNPDERLPLASVTKVMSALIASETAPDNVIVTVSNEAVMTEGDSGLSVGERFHLGDLLNFTLTASSNDGIRAIALSLEPEQDFIAAMNKEADVLGMRDTYYLDDTGLDLSPTKAGAYGSAKDMATLFAYVLKKKPSLLDATERDTTTVTSVDGRVHIAKNTDAIVGDIPGLLASKTGSTDLAGGNLVVAFDPELDRPIIVAVLGSTDAGRFSDVGQLITATLQAVSTPRPIVKR